MDTILMSIRPQWAEMQEWLLKNGYFLLYSMTEKHDLYECTLYFRENGITKALSRTDLTFDYATRLAYEWAKKQEEK